MSDVEPLLSVCELLLCEGVQPGSSAGSEASVVLRYLMLSFLCLSASFWWVEFNLAPVQDLLPAQYYDV